jgi:acyl dehydratase
VSSPPLPPRDQRYREDYVPGATYTFGEVDVTLEEVIAFAEKFDPQPALHTDPELAAGNSFGGIIASGWHTIFLMMRLYVDHYLSTVANSVSPGVDKIQWLRPVRPGDRLSVRVSVLSNRAHQSRADRGSVMARIEGFNQAGELVASLVATSFMFSRNATKVSL